MGSHEQSSRTGASDALSESGVDGEGEYESDSEGTSALALRRREASDDEEDDVSGRRTFDRGFSGEDERARPPFSDDEVEDEGAPPADEEEEEYEDAMESTVLPSRRNRRNEDEDDEEVSKHHGESLENAAGKVHGGAGIQGSINAGNKDGIADDKKDAEPFVVPTAGAFYMHDDRFRDNGGARPRRSSGGRKLWEAKDEKPWVHDRFEELNLHEESHHGQGLRGRNGRGRLKHPGRGRGRGKDPGYTKGRGNRDRVFEDSYVFSSRCGSGRGRGLRRPKMDDYEEKDVLSPSNRAMASSSHEPAASSNSTPQPAPKQPTIKQQESSGSKKLTAGSILNSASPPFYPSGSLSQSLTGLLAGSRKSMQGADEKLSERDVRKVGRVDNRSRTSLEKGVSSASTAAVTRQPSMSGKSTSLVAASNALEMETGLHRSALRSPNNLQQQLKTGSGSMLQHTGSGSMLQQTGSGSMLQRTGSGSVLQQKQLTKAEGKAQPMIDQLSLSTSSQQTGRGIPLAQSSGFLRVQQPQQQPQTPKQGQVSQQQPLQSQTAGPSVAPSPKPAVDPKASPLSSVTKLPSSGSGRGGQVTSVQAGRGSFVYNAGSSGGLTNSLRSVVQFAGQPQAGIGVPAVGVALPGYSSQPQFGFANSEVTWVPILAGGGALGSNYSSPYITVDGSSSAVYYAQPTSQPGPFAMPGREMNGAKPPSASTWKPPTRTDFGNDEFGQRQSKPRRYSEMNFGQ